MSRQLTRTQTILLGLVVLIALGLAGTGLFVLHDRSGRGQPSFHVTAGFADIAGIEVGSRVRIQGIDAGEVEAILPPETPGEPVKLRLRLLNKYHALVGSDARVQLASDGLLAARVVRVVPGSKSAVPVEDGGELMALVQPDLMESAAQATGKLNALLTQVEGALRVVRQEEDNVRTTSRELADATRKLNRVLAKSETALDGLARGEGTLGKLLKDETLYTELTAALAHVKGALYDIERGNGTLGKLVKTNEAYAEAVGSLQDVRRMVASVKQNSDAVKQLPLVRSYVVDPHKELVRPDMQRLRKWFDAGDLFEPNRAVLTERGKQLLDETGPWLNEHKEAGTEVVVAGFAPAGEQPEFTQTLTQKQSEAVADYLKSQHRVQRTGWWWWSNRAVRPVGCGSMASPVPETERLPAGRVELIVFVPQS